ncbi:DUF1462 family protein [Alkalicoccus urumqiensis]|uniref:Disulfide oxidoreductase n=1 Tax=Alkalicoccus urumqiensis TaxID=1548213 RepID=A0A2P6MGX1_ALKUR|nr:DUF1462 family protein [Alkalicoccus urumqiensis]PRO65528.1 disulfide oxidoreductase [Alkalicoccus urumqiensis]
MKMTIYGAEKKCASCIHLPSALETKEWLEAALSRRYPDYPVDIVYCDIEHPVTEEEKMFSEKILEDEYMYPLLVAGGEVIAEGEPRLKAVGSVLESHYKS